MVEEGWEDDRPRWVTHTHLAGRRMVLLVKTQCLPDTEVRHKSSGQVVTDSGAVDHLDEEAVRDGVETNAF